MSTTFTTIAEACVALQQGKTDKGAFLTYAKSRQHETAPVLKLMVDKVLTMQEVSEIIAEQQKLAASGAPKVAGALYCKTSKRGAVSIYGLNSRMPVTLYPEQAERLLKWLNAPADNPIAKHIAENKPVEFDMAKDFAQDQDLLAEILAGKHPHAKVVGQKVVCVLSRKAK